MHPGDEQILRDFYAYDNTVGSLATNSSHSHLGIGESQAAATTSARIKEHGLICEECEREDAVWRCQACDEVFCDACLALCHFPSRTKPHPHHQQELIRRVTKGDVSSVFQRAKHNPVEDQRLAEETYKPMSVMQPPPLPKTVPDKHYQFRRGEYVLFVEPWERRQAYGRVLVVPDPRDAAASRSIRRGEGLGEMYSVEMIGPLTELGSKGLEGLIQNNDELDKEEGVQLVDEGNTPVPKDLRFGQYQARNMLQSNQRRWELLKAAEKTGSSDEIPGLNVCVLPARSLFRPADKHLLLGADKFLPFRAYLETHSKAIERAAQVRAIAIWRQAIEIVREEEEHRAAVRIQIQVRAWLCRDILSSLKLAREQMLHKKWEAVHAKFRYIKSHQQRGLGYSADGRRFFALQRDLNMYHFHIRKACRALSKFLWRNALLGFECYFKHWRSVTSVFTEPMILGSHFDHGQTDRKSRPLRVELADSREYPLAHTLKDGVFECILTDNTIRLPRLPVLHAHQTPVGELVIERPPSFNSFQARMKGPTDHSFWVVPGWVCAGTYPAGRAVRWKSQLLVRHHHEATTQLMLSGISTFVCLATDEEEAELCKAHHQMRLEEVLQYELNHGVPCDICSHGYSCPTQELEHKHQMAKGALKSLLSEYMLQIRAIETALLRMEQYAHENDIRYKDLVEKKRLALLTQMRQLQRVEQALARAAESYPKTVRVVRKMIEPNGVIPIDEMLRLVRDLEGRMIQGERLYVCSAHGHGRAGMVAACLLGRMYGLAPQDALQRIQLYHDACVISRDAPYKQSCPQTSHQRKAVEEVLSRSSVLPSGVIYRTKSRSNSFSEQWVTPVYGQSPSPQMVVKASGSRSHCVMPKLTS